MLKVAVVILNWNGKKLLEQFLPSILLHSTNEYSSIYVADNASTDNSVAFLKATYPTVNIIQNSENSGYAKGYNNALKNIKADIFVLVNSDIEVTTNWIEPVVNFFETNAEVAIVQPKIKDFKNKDYFEYAGAAGGFIDAYGYPFCRGRIFDTIEKDTSQYNNTEEIFWASGACFFVRADVFNQLNGFDDSYFAHQEEIDLCWRAINTGFKIFYMPSSVVYHVGGATLHNSNPKKTYLNFRNSLITLVKNLPSNKLFEVIVIRLILDGIAGLKFLIELMPSHTWAILKGHISFYFNFFKAFKKRTNTPFKVSNYYNRKSIVYQYFLEKKKTF